MRDHPRIRGEHIDLPSVAMLKDRIIPAYAGSTTATNANSPTAMDHPRIRGEHTCR